jgi:hypothetical protein
MAAGHPLMTTDVALIPLQRPYTIRFPNWHKLSVETRYTSARQDSLANLTQSVMFEEQLLRHVTSVNAPLSEVRLILFVI